MPPISILASKARSNHCRFQTMRLSNDVLLVFGIGLAFLVWATANYWRYRRTRHWVPVTAKLLEVRERTCLIPIGIARFPYLYPDVLYTYTFGETPFVGDRVSLEPKNIWVPDYEKKDAIWNDWAPGLTVEAYVDPNQPQNALLIRDMSRERRSHYAALFVSGCLIIALGFLLI